MLALFTLLAACGEPDTSAAGCRNNADCASGYDCVDAVCILVMRDAEVLDAHPDVGGERDADVLRCDPLCGPGEACSAGECVRDCRLEGASPCEEPLLCGVDGACVDPACALIGEVVSCGGGEFPPRCGPGTRCHEASESCVADMPCSDLRCDATGFCHGVSCDIEGGGIHSLRLEPPSVGALGAPAGLGVSASVDAEVPCGVSVTFELLSESYIYISSGGDRGIWRVSPDGSEVAVWILDGDSLTGLTADRDGTLFYAEWHGTIKRVGVDARGEPMVTDFAEVPGSQTLARIAFGPDGHLYAVRGNHVYRVDSDGAVTQIATSTHIPSPDRDDHSYVWSSGRVPTWLTGLAFSPTGELLVVEPFPWVYRVSPPSEEAEPYLDATGLDLPARTRNPYMEALAVGADGSLWVSFFPATNRAGQIFRFPAPLNPEAEPETVLDLAAIQAAVPETAYAGIHGMGFGADESLYFVNQNTQSNTGEPHGQLLALRPEGHVELIAGRMNFDWARGHDGDVVVAFETVQSVTANIRPSGIATASLDVPERAGRYRLRAFAIDPADGRIHEARLGVTLP